MLEEVMKFRQDQLCEMASEHFRIMEALHPSTPIPSLRGPACDRVHDPSRRSTRKARLKEKKDLLGEEKKRVQVSLCCLVHSVWVLRCLTFCCTGRTA